VLVFDIPLPHPGPYAFEISLDQGTALHVPLTVSDRAQ
jgi:hypothetical protein